MSWSWPPTADEALEESRLDYCPQQTRHCLLLLEKSINAMACLPPQRWMFFPLIEQEQPSLLRDCHLVKCIRFHGSCSRLCCRSL